MLAIIEDGGRQYRVKEGDILEVDLRQAENGGAVVFDKVCLIEDDERRSFGAPYLSGAKITATVVGEAKSDRVISMHFKKRKGQRTRKGHRQGFLKVRIDKIQG